jgi:cyclohexanone monooxygenase
VAALLLPNDHPIGTKRLCLDNGYFETFNRENVALADVRSDPIIAVTPTALRTETREFELDDLAFATGFDAVTGALLGIDIAVKDGPRLRDKWANGPRTYLGVMTAGFPNLFIITGPVSPSVNSNLAASIAARRLDRRLFAVFKR